MTAISNTEVPSFRHTHVSVNEECLKKMTNPEIYELWKNLSRDIESSDAQTKANNKNTWEAIKRELIQRDANGDLANANPHSLPALADITHEKIKSLFPNVHLPSEDDRDL